MPDEYVPLVDKSNNIIGKVLRKEMRQKNLLHRTVAFFIVNKKGDILVTKRAAEKDAFPGLFEANQGGTVSYGESYGDTVRREIEEEVGIKNPKIEFLFDMYFENGKTKTFIRAYRCRRRGAIKPQKGEVDGYFFVSPERLEKMIHKNPGQFAPDSVAVFRKYLALKTASR